MEKFILVTSEEDRDRLDRSICCRGAFRNFRDTVERLGLLQ